jgi:hypothetical protein
MFADVLLRRSPKRGLCFAEEVQPTATITLGNPRPHKPQVLRSTVDPIRQFGQGLSVAFRHRIRARFRFKGATKTPKTNVFRSNPEEIGSKPQCFRGFGAYKMGPSGRGGRAGAFGDIDRFFLARHRAEIGQSVWRTVCRSQPPCGTIAPHSECSADLSVKLILPARP